MSQRRILLPLLVFAVLIGFSEANFEDSRCRCTCASTRYFTTDDSDASENQRRYYTKTNVDPNVCTPQGVVRQEVSTIVDDAHMDAFLANCDCKHESRNTILLKVVVIFVMCLLFVLGTYMAFLVFLDPMLKSQRVNINYQRHSDEMEENIFANPSVASSTDGNESVQMRSRNGPAPDVLHRVEEQTTKWQSEVEEQRRKVMTDHTMLN
uniref:TMEM9 protein n=1 Tax=Panagrellus redivivus TaxID=6233 RepID=A0A7E4V9A3_PANRE